MVGLEAPPSSLTYQGVVAFKQIHLLLSKTPLAKKETVWWGGTTGVAGLQADTRNKEGEKKRTESRNISKESWE